ncbi:MAG: geranylgeranylglycerol-phosphate geranylgeranyltransferase [Methanotrichaceae archaeon]
MPVLLNLMRPANCLMASMAAMIGLLIANPAPETVTIVLVFFVVLAVTGAGNAINDYFDRSIDAVNRPERPIPSNRISPKKALAWSIILFASGCVLAALINSLAFGICLFNSALLYLYARNIKGMPLVGNLSVGYLTGSTFLFGGAAGNAIKITVVLFLLASLATVSREIEKDIEDMEGDKIGNIRTLPIVAGEKKSHCLALLFVLAAMGFSYLAPLGMAYLITVTVADLLFFVAVGRILQGDATKAQHALKTGMAAALIAFSVAALSGLLVGVIGHDLFVR